MHIVENVVQFLLDCVQLLGDIKGPLRIKVAGWFLFGVRHAAILPHQWKLSNYLPNTCRATDSAKVSLSSPLVEVSPLVLAPGSAFSIALFLSLSSIQRSRIM